MRNSTGAILVAVAALAAGALGLAVGRSNVPAVSATAAQASAPVQGTGPILYYRDPEGLADYSPVPKQTASGKDYLPVRASDDVSFEEKTPEVAVTKAPERGRVRFYRNPMGLPDVSPTPKKDSMGMDYLPVYEGEQDDDTTVKVSAGKLQKAGVRTEPVEKRTLSVPLRAPGTVQQDERRASVVALRFEGFIDTVADVTTGARVRKGDPLMQVYGPGLSSAAAEYLSALNGRTDGVIRTESLKGARRRLENLDAPESVIAEIERKREVPVSMIWPSPQDGEIVERTAVNGMRAAPGTVLFRIVDHNVVWVTVDVAERDLSRIAVGQTARVRIELPNPDDVLRPEMYADVEISTGTDRPMLTVADSAVIDSGSKQIVLLDKGDGRFEPREVKVGLRGAGRVEIKEGLAENDKVVVSANFLIDAESNLKAALSGLDTGEKPQ